MRTCAILTTEPNDLVGRVHNRMHGILWPGFEAPWLDPGDLTPGDLAEVFQPYPAERMRTYAVITRVNSPRYDAPDLVELA